MMRGEEVVLQERKASWVVLALVLLGFEVSFGCWVFVFRLLVVSWVLWFVESVQFLTV
jgi:hypothetical protein